MKRTLAVVCLFICGTLAQAQDAMKAAPAPAASTATQTKDPDPRHALRTRHIGYYLFAEGLPALSRRIGYHPPPIERLRSFLRRWKEDFYILGIFSLSCLLASRLPPQSVSIIAQPRAMFAAADGGSKRWITSMQRFAVPAVSANASIDLSMELCV